jgi:hypothetical protein
MDMDTPPPNPSARPHQTHHTLAQTYSISTHHHHLTPSSYKLTTQRTGTSRVAGGRHGGQRHGSVLRVTAPVDVHGHSTSTCSLTPDTPHLRPDLQHQHTSSHLTPSSHRSCLYHDHEGLQPRQRDMLQAQNTPQQSDAHNTHCSRPCC